MVVLSCYRWRAAGAVVLSLASLVLLALLLNLAQTACARGRVHAPEAFELGAAIPRRFVPRLSVATDYAPCVTISDTTALVPRSRCRTSDVPAPAAVLERAARAAEQLSRTPDVSALRATALVDLEYSAESGITIDRSISYLRKASQLSEQSANSLADLSAAYLVRATRTQNARDLLDAAEAASLALAEDPWNVAATFNRALALEQLGLRTQAANWWTRYMAADSVSPWAREAREHRARLVADLRSPDPDGTPAVMDPMVLARTDPGRASMLAWNDLLGRWGAAELDGDSIRADSILTMVSRLGDALVARGGDGSVAAATRAIRATRRDRRGRSALARAHYALSRAQQLGNRTDYTGALQWARRASAISTVSRPLRDRSALALGSMLMYSGRMASAESTVRTVRATVDPDRDRVLAARADWILGTIWMRTGRYEAALRVYRDAIPLFAAAHDVENVGAVQLLAGDTEYLLGEYDAGLAYSLRAAATLVHSRRSLWRHSTYTAAAWIAAEDGLPHIAADLTDASVAAADANGLATYRVESRITAAQMRAAAGDTAAARETLARTRSLLASVPPGAPSQWLSAHMQLASTALGSESESAVARLDSAATTFRALGARVWLVPTLLQRADVRFALGDRGRGRADLDSAIGILSSERSHINDLELRTAFLESARRAFDRAMLLAAAGGDVRGALVTLERERAAVLSPRPEVSPEMSPEQAVAVTQNGSPGTTLDFAVVGDTILCWTVARGTVRLTRVQVPHARLTSLIERARTVLQVGHDSELARGLLAKLYDILVRPAFNTTADVGQLTVIADGELASIPFAALFDRVSRTYIVERHAVRYAASLADANKPVDEQPSVAARARGPLVVVTDPAFDRDRFPTLPRLAGAQAESGALTRRHERAVVLNGTSATAGATLAALGRASVLHFAGHALFDDRHTDRSLLVLAPDTLSPTGALTAAAISRVRLQSHPLVVLAACETMRSVGGHSGDVSGLTRAFLHAGARGVVGSQWRVDDQATLALMFPFYDTLDRTHDAARSLQSAQVALIRSQDPALRSPSAWAAFRYAGQ